jgi:hypothetical protein
LRIVSGWDFSVSAGETMTPEEIDFFKWYAANVRELITMDAITKPKANVAAIFVFIVLGWVLHSFYWQVMS